LGVQNDDYKPGEPARHSKLEITRAILNRTLTRTCILGSTLAGQLKD
jgi:hypothetical protein